MLVKALSFFSHRAFGLLQLVATPSMNVLTSNHESYTSKYT